MVNGFFKGLASLTQPIAPSLLPETAFPDQHSSHRQQSFDSQDQTGKSGQPTSGDLLELVTFESADSDSVVLPTSVSLELRLRPRLSQPLRLAERQLEKRDAAPQFDLLQQTRPVRSALTAPELRAH